MPIVHNVNHIQTHSKEIHTQSKEKFPKNEFTATFEPHRYRAEKKHDTEIFEGILLSRNTAILQNSLSHKLTANSTRASHFRGGKTHLCDTFSHKGSAEVYKMYPS